MYGLATLPTVGWYVPWLLLSKYSDYCLLPVVEVGLCCPRRGGQVNHGVYMYFLGIDDCWNLSLRFVSSLESCVVKTLARVDWGSGFSEVLLWPDPGAISPGALGRRSLGCRWVEREWEDGEGVGCCSPLWIQRPFPGLGCRSPPLSASPFHVYKQVSAIYLKCTPVQGPQHLEMLEPDVDLIVLVIAYSSDKILLLWMNWVFKNSLCVHVFMRKNGIWLLFWGGFILFRGDSIRREKVHNVFSASLRKNKCRHELGRDKYKINGVLQWVKDNATI